MTAADMAAGHVTLDMNRPDSMNQASCDLSRLARNGLTGRVPGRNRCTLTRDGPLSASSCTRVCDHVPRPLMAPGPPHQGSRPHRSLTQD